MTEDGEGWRTPPRITLEDVARRAQVSRAMASIVMRDAPGASQTTRDRVWAAARELGYRPDVRARALAGQKSRLIGVMFGTDIGVFQFSLLDGLYPAAEQHGHSLVLAPVTKQRDEAKAAEALHDFRFDGLVMLGPHTPRPLLAGRVPVVVVGWHVDEPAVDSVLTSDERGMALAVQHLVDLGHRDITHFDGGEGLISVSRVKAYREAMRTHGLTGSIRVLPGGQTQLDGQRAARLLLDQHRLPSAVIAYNDDSAVGVIALLGRQGVGVPEQVSVVGWDDGAAAALSPVGLTTVAQWPQELARVAVERLVARIEGRPLSGSEIVLEPTLTIRESVHRLLPLS